MNVNEQLANWRHEGKWAGLYSLLKVEYNREFVRLAIRDSTQRRSNFRVSDNLRRLLEGKR